MKTRDGGWRAALALAVVAAFLAGPSPAGAARTITLPRAGQVGLGIQGSYGTLLKSGEFGNLFDNGGGIAVRLRYRMRYERALGLSFEGQRFGVRRPEAEYQGGPGRVNLRATLSGIDFYQMFGTRTKTTKMLNVGAGLAQTSSKDASGETVIRFEGSDGAYVSLGAGVERFVIHSWAVDLSTRYQVLLLPQARAHDLQVALGFIFYASY